MKLNLKQMDAIARTATLQALEGCPRPDRLENLTLGSSIDKHEGVFELYIPGERPVDAWLISRAKVDRHTGHVSVEVFFSKDGWRLPAGH